MSTRYAKVDRYSRDRVSTTGDGVVATFDMPADATTWPESACTSPRA